MARIIEFEGVEHEFPDDFTDEEISNAIQGISPSPIEAEQPKESLIPKEIEESPKTNYEKLAKKLQDANLFTTASSAMGASPNPDISRDTDGSWDLPYMKENEGGIGGAISGLATGVAQRLGARSDLFLANNDPEGIQNVFNSFQQENNLSDIEMENAWRDLRKVTTGFSGKEENEPFRVLSTGMIVPNMMSNVWADEQKTLDAIDRSNASEAAKMHWRNQITQMGNIVSQERLASYAAAATFVPFWQAPDEWALENNRMGDMGSPQFLKDYEKDVIDSAGYIQEKQRALASAAIRGNMKLASVFAGLAGIAGIDSAVQTSADLAEAQSLSTQGAPDAGLAGILLEEVPSLLPTFALPGGAGLGMQALGASARSVQIAGTFGAIAASGLQSAGMSFGGEILEGATPEEARADSIRSGLNTAVITGIFQGAGLGGVEKVAAGRPVKDITLRNLLNASSYKELRSNVLKFARDIGKSAIGEGAEEFADEFTNAFLNADPDSNLSDAWSNAEKAFGVGAFLGSAVDVALGAMKKSPDYGVGEVEQYAEKTNQELEQAGLSETANVLKDQSIEFNDESLSLPPSEEAENIEATQEIESAPAGPVLVSLNLADIQAPSDTGQGVAEAVFGPASERYEYSPNLTKESFSLRDIKGDTRKAVLFDGSYTDRVFNPETSEFEPLDTKLRQQYQNEHEGFLIKGSSLQEFVERPQEGVVSASSPSSIDIPEGSPSGETIDTSPSQAVTSAPQIDSEPISRESAQPSPNRTQTSSESILGEDLGIQEGDVQDGPSNEQAAKAPSVRESARSFMEDRAVESPDVSGQPIFDSIEESDPAVSQITQEFPDASPDEIGKRLVARALSGDQAARASLLSLESTEARQAANSIRDLISNSASSPDLDPSVRQEVTSSLRRSGRISNPRTSEVASGNLVATTTQGAFRANESALEKVIGKQKSGRAISEYIDSGRGERRIKNNLPVGSIITGLESGEPKTQRVVAYTEALPDGGVRHHLKTVRMDESSSSNSLPNTLAAYEPSVPVYKSSLTAIENIQRSLRGGSLTQDRPAGLKMVQGIVRAQFSNLVSSKFATDNLLFDLSGTSRMVSDYSPETGFVIRVNEELLLSDLLKATSAIDPSNSVAADFVARDFAQWVASMAYHELAHHVARQEIPDSDVINAMNQMLSVALASDGPLRSLFLEQARWRFGYDGSTGNGTLANLTDSEILDLLQGKKVGEFQFDTETLENELWAIGHEFLSRFVEELNTGSNTISQEQVMNRWLGSLIAEDGSPKRMTRIQTLANRLAELANRVASAITRFFNAHRSVDALPSDVQRLVHNLNEAMENGGFKAPDILSIKQQAFRQANDVLSQANQASAEAYGDIEAKRNLRRVIDSISGKYENPPVTIDPLTGNLVPDSRLSKEDKAKLQPSLDSLNRQDRADVIMRTSGMARALSTVLRHLNGGRPITSNSKIKDTFDPSRTEENGMAVMRSVERMIQSAIPNGLSIQQLIDRINNSIPDSQSSDVEREGYESLTRLFVDGDGMDNKQGRDLVRNLADATRRRRESPVGSQEYLQAGDDLDAVRNEFMEFLDDLMTPDSEGNISELGKRVANIIETNRIGMNRALRELRNQRFAPIRSLNDLINRYSLNPSEVLRRASLDSDISLASALDDAVTTRNALTRLANFPEELEFLTIGGKLPRSMQKKEIGGWQNINAKNIDRGLSLMPLNLGLALRPISDSTTMSGLSRDVVRAAFDTSFPDIQELLPIDLYDTVRITASSSLPNINPEDVQGYVEGLDYLVSDSSGQKSVDSEIYTPIIESAARDIQEASRDVSRILGVEANSESPMKGYELLNRMAENANVLTHSLSENLGEKYWRFDSSVNSEVIRTQGFPIPMNTDERFSESLSFPSQVISIPDVNLDPSLGWNEGIIDLMNRGFVGELLSNVANFVDSMQSQQEGSTAPLLSHSEGLTPAGFAYQMVAPKLIEFLALTKGPIGNFRYDETIVQGSSNPDRIASIYRGLAPNLENTGAFSQERAEIERSIGNLSRRLWDLYRSAKVANDIYATSMMEARDRSLSKINLNEGVDPNSSERFPLDLRALSTLDFQTDFISRSTKTNDSTIVTLLNTKSAQHFIDLHSSLDSEEQMIVGVLGNVEGEQQVVSYDRQGANPQDSESRIEADDANQDFLDREARRQEDIVNRREKWRASSLMALFGGDLDTVLKFVHRPEFSKIRPTPNGPVYEYDSDSIDRAILDQLYDLRTEEIARGVVLDGKGGSFDAAINDLLARDTGENEAVLNSLLNTGGILSKPNNPSQFVAENTDTYDASASSVVSGLAFSIPGLVSIEGNAPWQLSQDFDNNRRRIPTVAFVADSQAPTLVFPYGGKVEVTEADYREAAKGMIQWLGDYGNVDIQEAANRILAPIANIHNDPLKGSLKRALEQRIRDVLYEAGFDESVDTDAHIAASSQAWANIVSDAVTDQLSRVTNPDGEWFVPEIAALRLNNLTNEDAAVVLSNAMTDASLKKVLLISLTEDPNVPVPTKEQVALYGDLIGSGNLRQSLDAVLEESLSFLDRDIYAPDSDENSSPDDVYETAMSEAFRIAEEAAGKLDIDDGIRGLSREGISPISARQGEWANNLLYSVMNDLSQSSAEVEGLLPIPVNRQLTLMEARQLLAVIDPSLLVDATSESPVVWNMADGSSNPTANDLIRVSGEAADRLRQLYNRTIQMDDSIASITNAYNYGNFAFTDPVTGNYNHDVWHELRTRKGAISKAEQLGAAFVERNDKKFYVLDADPMRLEQIDSENGTVMIQDGTSVWQSEAARFAREKAELDQVINDLRSESIRRQETFLASQEAIAKFNELKSEATSMDSDEFLERVGYLDPENLIPTLFSDRAHLASTIAQEFVDDFNDYRRTYFDYINTGNLSGMSKSPTASMLSAISLKNTNALRNLSQSIQDNLATLQERENLLRPDFVGENSYNRNGIPSWYSEIPSRDSSILHSIRRQLRKDIYSYNSTLESVQDSSNRLIPNLIDSSLFELPIRNEEVDSLYSSGQLATRLNQAVSEVFSLRDNDSLIRMASNASVISAANNSQIYNPESGVFSPEFGYRQNNTIDIPAEAVAKIQEALRESTSRAQQIDAVSEILNESLFPRAEAIQDAITTLESRLKDRISNVADEMASDRVSVQDILSISKDIESFETIDSVTSKRIVLDTIQRALDGKIATDAANLERIMDERARNEAKFNERRHSLSASRPNGFSVLNLFGNPDDIEVTQRVLAQYGNAWSHRFQSERSNYGDGALSQEIATATTDELMSMGADLLRKATGERYRVSSGMLMPEDAYERAEGILRANGKEFSVTDVLQEAERLRAIAEFPLPGAPRELSFQKMTPREAALAQIETDRRDAQREAREREEFREDARSYIESRGEDPSKYESQIKEAENKRFRTGGLSNPSPVTGPITYPGPVGIETNKIMAKLRGTGMFSKPKGRISKFMKNFDLGDTVELQYRDMIARMIDARNSKEFVGKGARMVDGVLGQDLHTRVSTALENLSRSGSPDVMSEFSNVYNNLVAYQVSNETLDSILSGYTPGEFFDKAIIKMGMHHDAKIRALFAKSIKSQKATNQFMGMLEFGTEGKAGRNASEAISSKIGKLFTEETKKIKDKPFETTSQGYMAAAFESFLMSGPNQMARFRAEQLVKILEQADRGYAAALNAGVKEGVMKKASEVSAYFTEESHKALESRKVYALIRDAALGPLQEIANGSIEASEGIRQIWDGLSDDAKGYGQFIKEVFGYVSSSFVDAKVAKGGNRNQLDSRPLVPLVWNTYNREMNETRDIPPPGEMISMDRAIWMRSPNRTFDANKIEVLNVNGAEAPMRILSDMIYRMMVDSSYSAFATATGITELSSFGAQTSTTLKATEGNEGVFSELASERFGETDNARDAKSAIRAVSLIGQELVQKDITSISPKNRLIQFVHEFQILGSLRALHSLSQPWRQSVWPWLTYATTRQGFIDTDFMALSSRYLMSKIMDLPARVLHKFGYGEGPSESSYSRELDEFVQRYAAHVYNRTPSGEAIFLNESSMMKPSRENRPQGRITGRLRPVTDALTAPVRKVHQGVTSGANWLLEKEIASPEKMVSRPIFVSNLLRQINEQRAANGDSLLTERDLFRDAETMLIPSSMLQNASVAVTDMMSPSDQSKKADLFRPTKRTATELVRNLFTTFASFQSAMSANSYAAWQMIRNGDAETKKEGQRIIRANLTQNVLFQVGRYELLTYLGSKAIALLAGLNDEEEEDLRGWFHGIPSGGDDNDRRSHYMHWIASILGGSSRPFGWDPRTSSWNDSSFDNMMKMYEVRIAKELVAQTPFFGIGILASTTLGSDMAERIVSPALSFLPGEVGQFERAGMILDNEDLGFEGLGPRSENKLERMAYNTSRFFLDEISSRSTFTNGISSIVDPITQMTNSLDDISTSDALLLWGAQAPIVPREMRREVERVFRNNTDAKIWHSSWK